MTITDTRPTTPDDEPSRPMPEPGTDEWGELLVVDPATLVIGANVRREVTLDKSFLRSIADRGVREPITVRRRTDGALVVRKGKRRALAAVETGRATVPVLVECGVPDGDSTASEERSEQIERIVDQLEENQHRASTSEADEVRAHQQLLDLGLTAGQIARRTHVPTARVKVTSAVARSELASAVLDRYDLTLDQVAVIAELDDGSDVGVEAAKVLTVTAAKEPTQFEHVAQRLRDQRDDAALVAPQIAELRAAGVPILDQDGVGGALQISGLRANADLPSGAELTVSNTPPARDAPRRWRSDAAGTDSPSYGSCTGASTPTPTDTSPGGTRETAAVRFPR